MVLKCLFFKQTVVRAVLKEFILNDELDEQCTETGMLAWPSQVF